MYPSIQNAPLLVRHLHEILFWPLQVIPTHQDSAANANHWEALKSITEQNPWEEMPSAFSNDPHTFKEQYYKEFVTFLPYVQRFLYGENRGTTGYGSSPIRVFRHREVVQVRLTFNQETQVLILTIQQANLLFFYDIYIIILVVEVVGHDLPLPVAQEVLFKFGRTYPAFWETNGQAGQCFQRVEWLGRNGEILAASDYEDREKYLDSVGKYRSPAIAKHWEYLLQPLSLHQATVPTALRYRQIEYHRMPLMAYLTVDDPRELTRADFVRLALVTRPGDSRQLPYAEGSLIDFERQYCYDRFWDPHAEHGMLNSRYLCCGHAFLLVGKAGDSFFIDPDVGLLGQFRRQYFLMCLIPHFHKAALHLFSEQLITAISHLDIYQVESLKQFKRDIRKILSAFLRFTHRYWFHEVSNQAQARDLFKMLVDQLGTEQIYRNLSKSVREMNQYLESDDLRRQAETVVRLTVVMTLSIIGTVTTGFLGMNLFSATENPILFKLLFFLIVMIPTGLLTLYTVARSKTLSEFLDVLSNEHLRWQAKAASLAKIWESRSKYSDR
ncbi:conserved hypothetical protein [Gammaproteobacteria bacterium]